MSTEPVVGSHFTQVSRAQTHFTLENSSVSVVTPFYRVPFTSPFTPVPTRVARTAALLNATRARMDTAEQQLVAMRDRAASLERALTDARASQDQRERELQLQLKHWKYDLDS